MMHDSGQVVVSEGYTPKISEEHMVILRDIYARYETTLENRLYRAMHELERLRTTGGSGGNQPHLL